MAERQRITLVCSVCQARNYQTTKAPKRTEVGTAIELKKFCKHCDKHTLHRESR
ncbi:MAG TPA: 50S ribosomal protein L33 [Polyangiaceae bacterium]|jgi:large subunit ribosomal protein L33|nr:50S ribosomal protein L33 [Polyangiaceae bacterium]